MQDELEKLYSHIKDIEVAMMTTRRADGHLQSRAMATQKRASGADLWFVTLDDSAKLQDPRHGTKDDPRMVLIGVDVHAAAFLEVNKPQPVVLFELVRGWLSGSTPELGEMHHVQK